MIRPRLIAPLGLALMILFGAMPASAQEQPASAPPTITGPLTLADAVQTALKHNPMAQAARSQATAARARLGMAKGMTRPQVLASAFGGNSTMGDLVTTPPTVLMPNVFSVPDRGAVTSQVGLMVPLYTGGRLSGAVRASEALSTAAASDQASVERNVTLETKVAYHRALLARAFIDVYKNRVDESKERVRIAEASFREGKIAKYDLLRNQAELADSEQQLANAERDARIALVDIKTALGVSQGSDIALTDQLAYAEVPGDLSQYTELAAKNRPELAAARARVESASANMAVSRSAYKPQVYINAMQGVTAGSDDTESGFTAGIAVGLPLVDGGQRRAAVQEARAMLDAMKQEEQQALLAVQQDVNTVWAEIQTADRNVKLSEAAVAQAEEDYRVIKLRYEAGKSINVEVLDALASLVRAQTNQLAALYEHNVARDRLARAIGEL
jgi:outer membrane protein TolC